MGFVFFSYSPPHATGVGVCVSEWPQGTGCQLKLNLVMEMEHGIFHEQGFLCVLKGSQRLVI